MHCLYGGYNLHRFSDALGLVDTGTSTRGLSTGGIVGVPVPVMFL